ncbi:MAG: hypothetical protein HEP71_31590 [Roseivirga sp.]|nr:hypothetical protein [Roseivirga sp.]
MKNITTGLLMLLCTSISLQAQQSKNEIRKLSDAPKKNRVKSDTDTTKYLEVISNWTSVEQINQWIGQNFHYDMSRAIALGSKRNDGPKTAIFSPDEFFRVRSGICVDLSRFAFETLKKINPEVEAYYLMIDFEPIEIQGSIIRKHWVLAYKLENQFYITADSKVPGKISGPFDTIQDFITGYEKFRERKIESFKLLNDYKKTRKKRLVKNLRSDKKGNQKVDGET